MHLTWQLIILAIHNALSTVYPFLFVLIFAYFSLLLKTFGGSNLKNLKF